MNTLLMPTIMILSTTIVVALLVALPRFQPPTVPLGVRIPTDYSTHPSVTQAVRNYRRVMYASWLIAVAISVVFWRNPIAPAFASFIVFTGSVYGYVSNRKHIIATKKSEGWFSKSEFSIAGRISSERLPSEITKQVAALPTPQFPWLSTISALSMIAVATIIVAMRWSEIPDTIPVHWGAQLQPDAWEDKTIGSVFFLTFISLFLLALMSLLSAFTAQSTVRNRSDRSIRGQIRLQVQLAATNTSMGWLIFALCTSLSVAQIITALPDYQHLAPLAFILIMVATFGSIIAMGIITLNYLDKADKILRQVRFEDDGRESPDNDEHFKFGMFYYNPDDPAVWVAKRYGVGMDFNYARWQGKAFITVVVLILCGVIALPIVLS